MGIGTSLGAYYDDAHHYAAATWDPKYETEENKSDMQKAIDKSTSKARNDSDQGLIRLPLETSSAPEGDQEAEITADYMQQQMANSKDPGLITSDSGDVVDYDYTDLRPNNRVADAFNELPSSGEADLPVRLSPNSRVASAFDQITPDSALEFYQKSTPETLGPELEQLYSKRYGPRVHSQSEFNEIDASAK